MRKIPELFLKGKILIYLVRTISFIFCFTLGSISLFIFSVAGTHFAKVGAGGSSDKLSYLFT